MTSSIPKWTRIGIELPAILLSCPWCHQRWKWANGEYRAELRRAVTAIQSHRETHHHPEERVLLRLDGQYGTGAVLADLSGLPFVMRGRDYQPLKRAEVQARLKLPPDQHLASPESGMERALYDCPDLPLGPEGMRCRLIVATHPASDKKSRIGVTRSGLVYELFVTKLPQSAFTAADVVALYLHRGAFETALADEDLEQEPDRWVSHTTSGQATWQIISQWTWNLRLELGHKLAPEPVRTTEFAPALSSQNEPTPPASPPASGYASPATARPWKAGRFTGTDFSLQPDGTLRCPAGSALLPHEQRREAGGSLRVVYRASIRSCRPCPLREQCQWNGSATDKPRQVSVLLHPLVVGSAPLRLRGTGTDGTSGMLVCVCIANAWISRWSLLIPPLRPSSRRRSLGRSGRIIVCHRRSGWLATHE